MALIPQQVIAFFPRVLSGLEPKSQDWQTNVESHETNLKLAAKRSLHMIGSSNGEYFAYSQSGTFFFSYLFLTLFVHFNYLSSEEDEQEMHCMQVHAIFKPRWK